MIDMKKVIALGEKISDDLVKLLGAIEGKYWDHLMEPIDKSVKASLEEMKQLYPPLAEAYQKMYEQICTKKKKKKS